MPVRVRETYLEIQEISDDVTTSTGVNGDQQATRVVTLLELLSPWNKRSRKGRREYTHKRTKILNSMTNLVEIDLLRSGERMNPVPQIQYDYSILVSPAAARQQRRPVHLHRAPTDSCFLTAFAARGRRADHRFERNFARAL